MIRIDTPERDKEIKEMGKMFRRGIWITPITVAIICLIYTILKY